MPLERENPTIVDTEWVKIGNFSNMTFVGKDVVAFGKGCFIILYNTTTQEEIIYKANSEERGEGVQCLVGYQQAHMFAFAEMSPYPRVFLVRYPSLEHVCILQDLQVAHTYLAMSFAEMECLVCLTGIPVYEIVVWCWRTGTKLVSQPTGVICQDLQVRCSVSMPIGVTLLAKHERETVFQLWQVNICSKLCLLSKTEFINGGLDANTYVSAFCWSPEGTLMVADTNGNLYQVKEETQSYSKVFSWPYRLREGGTVIPTNTLWWMGGVVMSGPNGFIQFIKRVSNTEFQPGWCITNQGPLLVMCVNRLRDNLVGWSQENSLVQLSATDQSASLEVMKFYGAAVRLFSFIHPMDDYFATISVQGVLDTWHKKTATLVGSMQITNAFVLDMQCNPQMPYLALGRSDGTLQIIATSEGDPYQLSELHLCSEEITGVTFSPSGTLIVVASYKIGRIFVTQGLVGTGHRINVLNHLLSNQPIVDMIVMLPGKLLVLVNDEMSESPSGKQVCVYSLPRLEVEASFTLDTTYHDLLHTGHALMAVPYISRQIHFLNLEMAMDSGEIDVTKTLTSGHQIRKFHISLFGSHLVSFGWDGLIFLRCRENLQIFCILEAHHRFDYGVKYATVDRTAGYILSLGKEGNFVCTKVLVPCGHVKKEHAVDNVYESYFAKKPMKSPSAMVSAKTWLETQIQQKLNLEAAIAAPEIKNIIADFKVLQKELVQLLNENYRAPPEEQLEVLEFDLDTETRETLLADAELERDNVRRLLEAECRDCLRLSEVIKKNTWDHMEVKSRCIKAMLDDFSVDNYGLPPNPHSMQEQLVWECEARKLTIEMSQGDHFEPWFPFPNETKSVPLTQSTLTLTTTSKDMLDNENRDTILAENQGEAEKENPYLLFGSSSYQFVEISPLHCSQFEMCSSFANSSEIILLKRVCLDLREYFNKLFDDMFLHKEKEMALLADRNARLRHILSELRITCNAPMDVLPPEDAQWSQEEKTEKIVTIEDSEVAETPYISPSEQALLDQKAAEEERIRRLLAADNFRELALIEMMDGMLEVRWEDELKKEVPKPKCMLEKDPEDYNEADLKAIKEYDEKCKILLSERERYRKMLEIEYKKLESTIQESLTKFDNSLFELFQTRLKVDAAMNHEQLKILRIHQLNDDRIRREIQEKEIVQNVQITEKESDYAHKQVALMQEATTECRNNYDALVVKDKAMGKKFKQEFSNTSATPAVLEQLVKYFRRRPKLQQRATQYPTLLLELARCVVDNDNSSFMPPEFHEFLSALETLDLPSSAAIHFDETVWATLVRVRRAKIESELKVRAYALELKEAEYTLSVVTKQMKAARERASANVAELRAAREDKIRLSRDLQVQIVMKQGLVETPLTGHISDFEHAILINPKIVEKINQHVKSAGSKKLDAMKQVTKFHRINKYKEWEYKKMRMECEDLAEKLNNIESIKVTLEVKQYLKELIKPHERDQQEDEGALLKQTEDNYKNTVKSLKDEIISVDEKIENFKKLNKKADKSILDLKCDVSEQQLERDLKMEETVSEAARRRMDMIVRRSQLVARIQQVHNDNLLLGTKRQDEYLVLYCAVTEWI
ncbi:cilia- and flagella-associated protein 43 isoform X2 [Homalodisca vitripennis]|uniref:cilia- and flagella-associated protein 43 isoform X2 n=1 Tax=Homalodisca vitripennis TaxID=197043 RepID=UPI001EE9E3C6|nr:cilia- and flagella-associated protein 43 isoform X2 [Homalodisca vitripennis]